LNGEKIIIDGKKILKRPEERIGKWFFCFGWFGFFL
jgi:RNase P/RNase MRP subunit p29